MNSNELKRKQIKSGLSKLSPKHRQMFNRMYSHKNLEAPINKVVDNIGNQFLDSALYQVTRTLENTSTTDKLKNYIIGVFRYD